MKLALLPRSACPVRARLLAVAMLLALTAYSASAQSTPLGLPQAAPQTQIEPPPGSSEYSIGDPASIPRGPQPRTQVGYPDELRLSPPSKEDKLRERRFIPSTIDPELPLRLVVGRPKVLQLVEAAKRIYTPADTIIRTEIIDEESGKEVAVTGLQPGSTTLFLWFNDPEAESGESSIAYDVRVYADPLFARPVEDLQAELNEKFPNSYIELDEIADRLLVRGQVPDAIEMSQILNVLLGTRNNQNAAGSAQTQAASTAFNLTTSLAPRETTGERLQAEREDQFANRLINARALASAGIINQLKVVGEQQVMLKVTVAEVNRDAARSIGLNFSVDNDSGDTVFQTLTGNLLQNAGGGGGTGNQTGANLLASLDMGQVRMAIEALRRMNLSRTLAEPNLIAMNGEMADFQAGGQFPIPVISSGGVGNNLQGVTFVPFGVQLEFTPFIQERDVIRLRMNAEVSTRNESLGTNIGGAGGGTAVSGLNSRNFSTTIQLRSGQTVAVAGLLQTNYGASSERVPFWGDLPLIGATGGVNRSSSGEQELVILVTPHLIAPVSECEGPALPGDDVHEPTDIEFYLSNRLESRRSRDFRATVRTDYARQKNAEHCCPEQYMIGDVGPTDRCCPSPIASPHRAVLPIDSYPHSRGNPSELPDPSGQTYQLRDLIQGGSDE